MMNRKILLYGILIFLTFSIYILLHERGSRPLEFNSSQIGIIPDAVTAIKVAEIIGVPVFGKNLNDYKPFHAYLKSDSIWYVYGLPKKTWTSIQLGGAPVFEIQKRDGKVLKISMSR
jgi:hypothetical protein